MRQTKLRMSAAILTFCGLVNGFAQDIQGEAGKWTFIGQLTNPEKTLFVAPLDNLEDRVEVVKENGCFTFTTDLDVAMDYMIFSSAAEKKNKGGISILVTAVPGEVLTARGFCDNNKPADGLTFGGTPFYRDYTLIHTICADVQEQEDALGLSVTSNLIQTMRWVPCSSVMWATMILTVSRKRLPCCRLRCATAG